MKLIQPRPLTIALSIVCMAMQSAWAQNITTTDKQTADKESSSTKTINLAPVVVSATKQNTTTFNTASSVHVIDGTQAEKANIQNLNDVAQQVPNVHFSDYSNGAGIISIRGMGNRDDEADATSIGLLVDGVSLPMTSLGGNLYDIDHIEILKGPQSVLYGQGNVGGLIAVKTRDPGSVFGGTVSAEYGSYNSSKVGAALDIPLASKTAVRVVVGREDSDGYINNKTLHRDDTAQYQNNYGRIKLLHTDDAGGEWRLGLHYSNKNGGNDFFIKDADASSRNSDANESGTNNMERVMLTGEYTKALDARTRFTANVGMSDVKWNYWLPASVFGATNGFDMHLKSYQAEARLQQEATQNSPFDWLAGVHVVRTELDRPYLFAMPGYSSATSSNVDGTALALYGEAGWHFAPKWRVAAGLRLSHDEKEQDWSSNINGYQSAIDTKVNDNTWLPQLTLEYRPDEQQFIWGRLARGYKASGFNIYSTSSINAGQAFKPEYANYAELGYRLKDKEDNWSIGAVAFYTKMRDQQVVVEGLGGELVTDNAGKSHNQGIELDAAVKLTKAVEVRGNFGYVKAVYDDYSYGGVDYSGKQFYSTPRTSMGMAVTWKPADDWEMNVSARRIGKNFLQTTGKEDTAYTIVDANLSWFYRQWTFGIYGKNLTDEKYLTRAISDSMGGSLVATGAPRTVGMRASYDF